MIKDQSPLEYRLVFPLLPIQTRVRGFSIKSMKNVLSAGCIFLNSNMDQSELIKQGSATPFKGTAARDGEVRLGCDAFGMCL